MEGINPDLEGLQAGCSDSTPGCHANDREFKLR